MKQPDSQNTVKKPVLMSIYKPRDQDWFMLMLVSASFPAEVFLMGPFALLEEWGIQKNSHV